MKMLPIPCFASSELHQYPSIVPKELIWDFSPFSNILYKVCSCCFIFWGTYLFTESTPIPILSIPPSTPSHIPHHSLEVLVIFFSEGEDKFETNWNIIEINWCKRKDKTNWIGKNNSRGSFNGCNSIIGEGTSSPWWSWEIRYNGNQKFCYTAGSGSGNL